MSIRPAARVRVNVEILRQLLNWPEDIEITDVRSDWRRNGIVYFNITSKTPAVNLHNLPSVREGDVLPEMTATYVTEQGQQKFLGFR